MEICSKNIFALIFEVSHGCQYSCSGCSVNKEASSLPDKAGFEKLKAFLYDLIRNQVDLNELEVAPTDILTSLNRDEIFNSPDFLEILHLFRIFTLNMSLVRPKVEPYVALAEQINATGYRKELQIVTPIELLQVHKDKYVSLLKRNFEAICEKFQGHMGEINLQVNFDRRFLTHREIGAPSIEAQFERIHQLDFGVTTKVNFALPHGRRPSDTDYLKEDLLESLLAVNRLYVNHLKKLGKDSHVFHLPYHLYDYACGGEGTWFGNELYIRPLFNERFTVFNDRIRLKDDWTYNNFAIFNRELTNVYIERGQQMSECSKCPQLVTCADRGVQEIMDWIGTEKCITLLRDYDPVRIPLTNGDFDKVNWDSVKA